ncbi:MAG: hypothetical protein EOR16_23565 [Mesorhizobium sp.]|uniref:hypothetical protein n=1 Tax=Mesorhizobium sp. TaxID=1871066 RepID=UPI000FE8188D|nr:hypothetical protein [Mesorhizobium sp.]RWI54762.1 MAG: hypothetical protein EOR16_23565 [Mesorhizobium sp.]
MTIDPSLWSGSALRERAIEDMNVRGFSTGARTVLVDREVENTGLRIRLPTVRCVNSETRPTPDGIQLATYLLEGHAEIGGTIEHLVRDC